RRAAGAPSDAGPAMRRRARARLALALAAALAGGCTAGGGAVYGPIGREPRERPPPPVHDDRREDPYDGDLDRAYDDGYSRGWGDREQGRTPAYERWADAYDAASERSFRTGYADGYQRRPHRYGGAGPDVTPVAPDWLVGEWQGWDEQAQVDVRLRVRRDGGVTLVGGGRAQEG